MMYRDYSYRITCKREFNLGGIFDIWNKKLDNSHLFDIVVRNTKNTLNVYVNGIKVSRNQL
jgi:hypothetical protein